MGTDRKIFAGIGAVGAALLAGGAVIGIALIAGVGPFSDDDDDDHDFEQCKALLEIVKWCSDHAHYVYLGARAS